MKKWYDIKNQSGRATIDIFGIIGDSIDAQSFKVALDALGDVGEIELNMHSRGGSAFEGLAIHSMLAAHPARITANVNGLAASIASIIIMAANTVQIAENSFIMIHNPSAAASGSSDELRRLADLSDQLRDQVISVYHKKTSIDPKELGKMMDNETWMNGREAHRLGFVDVVTEPVAIAACLDPEMFVHAPTELVLKDSGLTQEIRAEWRDSSELRAEFLDFESFMAYKKNVGNITIIADRVAS
jgi:ATP-dependent protease ClpP protease subunit